MAFLFSLEQAKSLLDDPFSCFKCVTSTKKITLPHYFVGDHRQGAKEFLNLGLKRYSETLDGILITYYDTMLLSRNGCIMGDSPFFSFDIRANFIVFRPNIGSTLKGVVNKLSPAHIGCLVHGHFNASIFKKNEEEWNSPHVQVGSRITFEVTHLDLYSRIIFIRGKLLGVEEPDSSFLQGNYEVDPCQENEKIITINKTSSSVNKIKFDSETDDGSDVDSQKIVHLDIEQSTKKSPKRETKGKINKLGKLSGKDEKQKLAPRNVFHKDSASSDSDKEETHNTNSSSIESSSAVSPKKSTKSKSSLSDKSVKKQKSIKKTPVASKERKLEPMSNSDSSDSDMFSPEKSTNKNTQKIVQLDIEQSTMKSPKRETKGQINELGKISAKDEKQKLAPRNIVFHKDASSSDSDNVSECQGNDKEETHNTSISSIESISAVSPKKSTKSKSSSSDKRVKKQKSIKKTPVASIEISSKERKLEPMSSSDSSDSDRFSPEKSTNKNTPKALLNASQKRDRKADSPAKKVTKTISKKTSNFVKQISKNGKSSKGSEIDQNLDLSTFEEAEISKIFEQAELEKSIKQKSSSEESLDSKKKKKSSNEESSDSRKKKKSSSGESSGLRKKKSEESTDSKKKNKQKKKKDANKDEKRKKKKSKKEKKLESESAEKKKSGSNRKRKLSETLLPQAKHRKKSKKEMASKE